MPNEPTPLPGHPEFCCSELTDELAEALIARTRDADDVRLREMTRDLSRFSSMGQLAHWRPGRDLLCLQDESGELVGLVWIADKPLPERDDYLEPELLRTRNPRLTCAIRTYGYVRGRGRLTKDFAEHALARLLSLRPRPACLWYETKAHNLGLRALAKQIGFAEASGDAGGAVIGVRCDE